MWAIVISILTIIITLSFLCYLQRVWYFEDLKNVTKEFGWPLPLIMDAIHLRNPRKIIESLLTISKKNGKRYKVSIGFDNYIVLTKSEDIRVVLNSQELLSKGKDYKSVEILLEGSLLISTGKKFTQRKKLLVPMFHMSILRDLVPTFEAVGNVLIEVLEEKSNESPIDVFTIFSLYTLDVFFETSLGVSLNAQRNVNNEYIATTNKIVDIIVSRRTTWWKRFEFIYKYSSEYRKLSLLCHWYHNYTYKIIDQRRQTMTKLNGDLINRSVEKKCMFLDMLINSTIDGVQLSNEDIKEEVAVFMIAGRDTNTSTLSFSLYCLAQHPEIQEKLLREQRDVFGEELKYVHATFDDLAKMNYLEMVIKEVLRLYPSIPFFTREAKTNISTKFGTLKTGLQILLSPLVTHRNPEYFPEPEKFDPERFSPQNLDNIKPFTYIPFSLGYRNCIGSKFAMISLKSALSKIVRNFEIHPDLTYNPILVHDLFLRSQNGVRVIIKKRV